MARQKYEEKRTISIIGTLNKVEDGKYTEYVYMEK